MHEPAPSIREPADGRVDPPSAATTYGGWARLLCLLALCGAVSGCAAAGSAASPVVDYIGRKTSRTIDDWRYQGRRNEPLSSYEDTDLEQLIIDLDAMDGAFVILTTTLYYDGPNTGYVEATVSGATLPVGYRYLDRIDRQWLIKNCAKGCAAKLYGYVRGTDNDDEDGAVVALHIEH